MKVPETRPRWKNIHGMHRALRKLTSTQRKTFKQKLEIDRKYKALKLVAAGERYAKKTRTPR